MTSESRIDESIQLVAPVYLVAGGEFVLEAPVGVAWPHVIDFPSWQSYSRIEHISGKPGQEGEVVLLGKDEEGFEFPPYYARTVKLEPGSRVIWKTFPVGPPEGTGFFGIVDFRLDEAPEGKSLFVWNMLYEFQVPYESESELDTFRRDQYANFEALFASVLPKLQQQVRDDENGDAGR